MMRQSALLIIFSFFITISLVGTSIAADLTSAGDSEYLKYNEHVLLQDFSGKSHKLSEYTGKGKWLIVMIWASNCHVCNTEIASYIKFHEEFKNINATMLGISADGWEFKAKAQAFIDRHKVTFPNLIAAPITINQLYVMKTGKDLPGTPSFLVYSPSGELKAEQSGAVPTKLIIEFIGNS